MKTLIKNGRIVTACDDYTADVYIDGETVSAIGLHLADTLAAGADRVLDAAGKMVVPGGIDPHTHMELPFGGTHSSDDFRTGTIAAAFGGTTTIIDFAVQSHGQALRAAVDGWHAKAEGKCAIDYSYHLICTDVDETRVPEMAGIVEDGITSFKLFMAYPGVFLADDAMLFRVMSAAGDLGAVTLVHAENGIVINEIIKCALAEGHTEPKWHGLTRPTITEGEGTHRALFVADLAHAPVYIVHVSCADSLNALRVARDRGQNAYGETCPQYLFLDDTYYDEPNFGGAKYVMTPPLRPKANQAELWKGLHRGDLSVISTDHCPFFLKNQKTLGRHDFTKIPNGAPGVEDRLMLAYNGCVAEQGMSASKFVELTSTAAAKMFGLFPKKGTIAVGSDADIVIFDPNKTQTQSVATQHMNVDYNAYEGMTIQGVVETVLSRGQVIIENNQYLGKPGEGRFLKRGPTGAV